MVGPRPTGLAVWAVLVCGGAAGVVDVYGLKAASFGAVGSFRDSDPNAHQGRKQQSDEVGLRVAETGGDTPAFTSAFGCCSSD